MYPKLRILIFFFLFLPYSCSENPDVTHYCDEFSLGKIRYYKVLIKNNAFNCFRKNINNENQSVRVNSIKALAKTGYAPDLEIIKTKLSSGNFIEKIVSVQALIEWGGHEEYLTNELNHKNADIKKAILNAFIELNIKHGVNVAAGLLNHENKFVRRLSALYLAKLLQTRFVDLIKKSMQSESDLKTYKIKKNVLEYLQGKNKKD